MQADADPDHITVNAHELLPLETNRARCFIVGDRQVWVPKSQIISHERGRLTVPRWLAVDRGWASRRRRRGKRRLAKVIDLAAYRERRRGDAP